jgi:hypothetical protein
MSEILYYNRQSRAWAIPTTGKKLQSAEYPAIGLNTTKAHTVHVIDLIDDVVTPVNLAALNITAIQVSVDVDYLAATDPLCRTNDPAEYDLSQLADGIISYNLSGSSASFQTAIDGKQRLKAYYQIKCYNAAGDIVFNITPNWKAADWSIICEGDLDPATGTLPGLPTEYYPAPVVDAKLAAKFDKDLAGYQSAVLTNTSRIPVSDGKYTTPGALAALNAATNMAPQTFSTSGHSSGVISFVDGILTLSGKVSVAEVITHTGAIIGNIDSLITYSTVANETVIDLSNYAPVQGVELWTVRFAGGHTVEVMTKEVKTTTFEGLIYNDNPDRVKYVTLAKLELKSTTESLGNATKLRFRARSYSDSTGGDVELAIKDETGVDAPTVISLTPNWQWFELPISSARTGTGYKDIMRLDGAGDTLGTIDAKIENSVIYEVV